MAESKIRPSPRVPARNNVQPYWERTGELIKITNEDVARTRTELVFFLASVSFILLTTFGIDDRALLIGTHITLPIFGSSINLNTFLGGGPILLLSVHFVLLLKFRKLREKCDAIEAQLNATRYTDPSLAKALELRVASNFLTHWAIGYSGDMLFRWFNFVVYLGCLYLAPIVTLLFLMIRTLPLHDNLLTTLQSVVLFCDIWISLYVLRAGRVIGATLVATGAMCFFALLLSVPDSWQDRIGRDYLISARVPFGTDGGTRRAFWPTAFLLESEIDLATGRPVRLISRNLVVLNADLGARTKYSATEASGDANQKGTAAAAIAEPHLSLAGRNLRYATLDFSNLSGANLVAADLTGASLRSTNLSDAYFGCLARGISADDELLAAAKASCTKFDGANLEGVSLARVASHTTFDTRVHTSSFAGVNLSYANLTRADMPQIILDAADLTHTSLDGANLSDASLVGTNLTGASLIGATLSHVDATFAAFGYAELAGADLSASRLDAANFEKADLIGADLRDATLWGTSLRNANVWGVHPPRAEDMPLVDLSNTYMGPPAPAGVQQLEGVLNLQPNDVRFTGFATLAQLLTDVQNRKGEAFQNVTIWESWSKTLSVTNSNGEYLAAIGDLITRIGCRNEKNARGIVKWSAALTPTEIDYAEADKRLGHPPPLEFGPAPPDRRLDKLPHPKITTEYGWNRIELINPLPQWYDPGKFLEALTNRKSCKAGDSVPSGIISSLKASAAIRKSSSASR